MCVLSTQTLLSHSQSQCVTCCVRYAPASVQHRVRNVLFPANKTCRSVFVLAHYQFHWARRLYLLTKLSLNVHFSHGNVVMTHSSCPVQRQKGCPTCLGCLHRHDVYIQILCLHVRLHGGICRRHRTDFTVHNSLSVLKAFPQRGSIWPQPPLKSTQPVYPRQLLR